MDNYEVLGAFVIGFILASFVFYLIFRAKNNIISLKLESDINTVKNIIDEGNRRAKSIAKQTMEEVKAAVKI